MLDRIRDAFQPGSFTLEQQKLFDQLQSNRAKAVYLIPERFWKEFLNSIYSDAKLKSIVIQAFTRSGLEGALLREYFRGYLTVQLEQREFAGRLSEAGVDLKNVIRVMLENIT
jgi:hypothetical protein